MKLVWSPLATERISDIAAYIAADNPSAAEKWVNSVFDVVQKLSDFPHSGCLVPEMNRKDIREILFGNYRIIYWVKKERIEILSFRHWRQTLPLEEVMTPSN